MKAVYQPYRLVFTDSLSVHPCSCCHSAQCSQDMQRATMSDNASHSSHPSWNEGCLSCFHSQFHKHKLSRVSHSGDIILVCVYHTENISETGKRHRDKDERGRKRNHAPLKISNQRDIFLVLQRNERKPLLLLAALGMSESCFVHASRWFTAHWFHSDDWLFCEFQRTIHCPWDHLQLACMWHHSNLHQLSISINFYTQNS